jgi:hypothetical protein
MSVMPNAPCPMPNAPCPILLYERLRQRLLYETLRERSVQVPNAQCPMPHAQCPMPHALIQKGGNSLRIVNRI